MLKEELAGDPDVVMRFLRERSVLLRLRHPHIVRVRDLVVEGDLLALVMDLVDGPDLHRYLRDNGPFSPIGAALLTAAVADALAASHADGVVHRDLKPANVLLATVNGEDGAERMHPMLTDFGIARLADSPGVTRTHEFVGTPAYVAPESAQGRPQTSAVDIYGAGILMYELVTGQPPFRGDSALEVLHQHLSDEPRRPSTVPEPLWTVIERCLRKDPAAAARARRAWPARCGWSAAGIGVHATPAAAEAALGGGERCWCPTHDPALGHRGARRRPAARPRPQVLPASGASDPTQVLPSGARPAYDPNATTSVLPRPAAGRRDAAGGTRCMPPAPDADPGRPPQAQGPHPWESQLERGPAPQRADRRPALDPGQDPLRHRPRPPPAARAAAPAAAAAAVPAAVRRSSSTAAGSRIRRRAARARDTATRSSSRATSSRRTTSPSATSRSARPRRRRPEPSRAGASRAAAPTR